MPAWLLWSLFYVMVTGALGITSRLALRDLQWQNLVLWTAVGYALVAIVLLSTGQGAVRFAAGTGWAIASAGAAIGGLIALYLALGSGEASKVIPITAAYPAVTVLLAAIVLSETLSPLRILGTALVIAGAVMVAVAS